MDLTAGEHLFELEITPDADNAALDCFLLYRGIFRSAGKQKPLTDADTFQPYAENQQVDVIVREAREAAALQRVLADEVSRSKVREVDFSQVGGEIDAVCFGAEYAKEFQAHDGSQKLAKEGMSPRHVSMGRGQFLQRAFTAPRAGDYVLTIGVTWRYACHHSLFEDPVRGAMLSFAGFFVLAGSVPVLIIKLVFRERLADYGVGRGNRGRTVRSLLIMFPVILIVAYVASRIPAIRSYYPVNPGAGKSPASFTMHALTYLLFYLGWEFHFRRFIQLGLKDSIGPANAVFVQVMASTLLHIGTPGLEAHGAIVGGLWWGFLVFANRSILSKMLQHMLLGLALDYFIVWG